MKLSFVIAVKNQVVSLIENLKTIGIPYFDSLGIAYDVLIVSDHSNESSQKSLVEAMKNMPLQVKLLPYEDIPGKGHGVKKGILSAEADYIAFMDADFSTDIHVMEKILPLLGKYDCFIASRHSKGSQMVVKQPLIRKITSWGARLVIKRKFKFKEIRDTQCGFKVFRGEVAKAMAKKQIIDGFAFDVEYLYFLQINGFSIKEMPVIWKDNPSSSVDSPLKASLKFYKDLNRIKKNKDNYRLSEEERKALVR